MSVFAPAPLEDHALLDSGAGEKLERYGALVLRRPDPQAMWPRRLGPEAWEAADLRFVRESDRGGRWEGPRAGVDAWEVGVAVAGGPAARLVLRPTPFKHVGLFPEQAANWAWFLGGPPPSAEEGRPRLLNLFGYTGAASVLAAAAGWSVTHVDASRASLDWAAENARRSGLGDDAVRWILDDALKFAAREVRRGRRYEGVLLDPPHYGRGPKGEKWRLETGLAPLVEACASLLAPTPGAFLVLSTYAVGLGPQTLVNLLRDLPEGAVEAGELVLPETSGRDAPPRLLPCGFCARWRRGG